MEESKSFRKNMNDNILMLNRISEDVSKDKDIREYYKALTKVLFALQSTSYHSDKIFQKIQKELL